MQRAAIWDMDGTLVDTAEMHFQAWLDVCRERGRDFTRADFAATFGRRNPEIIEYLFGNRFTAPEVDALGNRKEELYRAAASKGLTLLPGVGELLENLQREGFRQAIGSSAPHANLELILRLTGVQRYFDAVVAMEDTTRGKPDPQVFLVAAQKLMVEPTHCIVFEDAVAGVQAARAGGMGCIAVRFVGHHPAEALRKAGANLIVHTLSEVTVAQVMQIIG
jgi:beta-phosphoglucomutase